MRTAPAHRPDVPLRGLGLWLMASALACAPAPGRAAAQTTAPVPRAPAAEVVVDSILSTPPLNRAHWGIAVDRADGTPVLRRNADRLFTAASTMKLTTAVVALDLLGPDFRFETVVEAEIDGDGSAPRLVVRGGGDPSLARPFYRDPRAPLDSLADSLAAAGLRRVTGPLIIDQSRFDSTLVHPAWETFDLDWYYAAPVAPMAIMESAFEVVVSPGRVGEPARVTLPWAPDLVAVDARIRTVPGRVDWDDVLKRVPTSDSLVLRGTIGAGAGPDTSWIAQTDPGRTAGRALRIALERAGIAVEGRVEVRYRAVDPVAPGPDRAPAPVDPTEAADGATAGTGVRRVVWRSPPLRAIIRVALERSDNWITEQVLKSLAAAELGHGDWSHGTDLVEDYLVGTVGVSPGAIYMRDGSGLTPQGLISPDAVVTLLRYAEKRWGTGFGDALPSPGEPESTLEDRLLGYRGRIQAKTGTLRHVNALSGYLRDDEGRELIFSILSNGSGRPSWEVQAAIDRIVASLMEHGS